MKDKRPNLERSEWYSCKICGRPNPDKYKEMMGKEAPFEEYLPWSKKQAIEHLKKEHKELIKMTKKSPNKKKRSPRKEWKLR